jgi:hypothetical protein
VDPNLQALIRASLNSESREQMESRLQELAAAGADKLVPQLLYYSVAATSTKDGMAFGVIVEALRLEEDSIVGPLIPFLGADELALRAETRNVLCGFERGTPARAPDFEAYRPLLEADLRAGKPPNVHLVQHMFESHPGAALLLFREISALRREESRALLWAEHEVADALWKYHYGFLQPDETDTEAFEQLAKLSGHSEWWVRLYVAQVMHRHKALSDARIVAALKQDAHELVRKVFLAGGE